MQPIRAAVIQAAPVVFNVRRTLDKVRALTADAARQGAQLVLFPEAFVSAYPKGLDFGARMGMRSPEGREEFRRYYESANRRSRAGHRGDWRRGPREQGLPCGRRDRT